METDSFNAFIFQQIAVADQQLLLYQKEQEPEALHQLRVAIKKIKAVAYFIEHLTGDKINTTPLKELFDRAATVREFQLTVHWVQTFAPEKDRLIKALQKNLGEADAKFIQAIPYLGLSIQYFKNQVSLPKEFSGDQQVIYCFQQLLKKTKLHHNREQLHYYRIAIKRIMYIYEALPEGLQEKLCLDTELINQQQKKLGRWHDSFTTKKYLAEQHLLPRSSPEMMLLNKQENNQLEEIRSHKLQPLFVRKEIHKIQ